MADLDRVPAAYRDAIESVLITEDQIQSKLDELAAQVDDAYAGKELLVVGVLKGAVFVLADLHRRLTVPCAMDFMAVSSYGSATTSSGVVRILKDLDTEIEGRDVLIVEDIVDSGLTLDYLMKNLRSRRPASVEVLALLTKPSRREVELPIRFVGFEVPDVFVVGYGLDFDEHYRGLRDIVTLKT
ncbi:MAG: hypoxanthine phosphoribosyltransferase [Chloroflexota bacterium]